MILDKKQKIKKLGNIKQNIKNPPKPQIKSSNFYVKSFYTKSPRQKSFIINKKKRNLKSNDISTARNIINDDDSNCLLSENDPFSRSVIYSNNKKIANNLFPSIKKKNISNNKNKDYTKRKMGSVQSVKNSNVKSKRSNIYNKLNISEDFTGISKFNDQFQLIEDKIIDKNYENDIDHDEIIIGTNRKNMDNDINNNLFNKIKINSNSNTDDDLYLFFNKNNNDNNDDEYLVNNPFENSKADFSIMYIDNYGKMINDDMLLLEIQLLYEKILDLQNAYHDEYNKNIISIKNNKKFISLIIYKYKEMNKKNFNLLKIKENISYKNKLITFFNIQEKEHKSYINEINNKEINLWNNMLGIGNKHQKIINKNLDNNNKIKDIFKLIVFNKYSSLKNSLNDIQNKIVSNLIKKYNYKTLFEIKNKNNKIYKESGGNSNNGIKNKKDKIKNKNNHKIINSNDIYENNNVYNKTNYNYIKHNKYSSYNNYINSSKKAGY